MKTLALVATLALSASAAVQASAREAGSVRLACSTDRQLVCEPKGCRVLTRNEGDGPSVLEIDLAGQKVFYGAGRTEIPVVATEWSGDEVGKSPMSRFGFQADQRPVGVSLSPASPGSDVRNAAMTYPPKPGAGAGRYIDVMACRPAATP